MFRRKDRMSRASSKESLADLSQQPQLMEKLEPVPQPPEPVPQVVEKKMEPKPKPVPPPGPPSIIPPGTKRVLVVGKFVVMTADVENCDAVIVQGNLDGNIKAKYIVVMKGGCMRGKLECEEADVAGSFEGMELIAHHRLTLSSTARVGGRTTYHKLSVQDGAVLTGELVYKPSTREKEKKSSDKKSAEKKAERKAERKAAERRAAEASGGAPVTAAPIGPATTPSGSTASAGSPPLRHASKGEEEAPSPAEEANAMPLSKVSDHGDSDATSPGPAPGISSEEEPIAVSR